MESASGAVLASPSALTGGGAFSVASDSGPDGPAAGTGGPGGTGGGPGGTGGGPGGTGGGPGGTAAGPSVTVTTITLRASEPGGDFRLSVPYRTHPCLWNHW